MIRPCGGFAAALVVLVGCGGPSDAPETGDVSGYVNLDGKPVAGARITFQPDDGRPSNGRTNAEGYYELVYSRHQTGAKVGSHTVRISTHVPAEEGTPATPETIPDVYNTKTELKETVEAGDNEIDFELDSKKGKVVQPRG